MTLPPPPPPGPGPSSQHMPPPAGGWPPSAPSPSPTAPPYGGVPATAPKPPRPRVVGGGALTIAGSLVVILSTFLTWIEGTGLGANLWDLQDLDNDSADGVGYVFFAVITIGLGIALVAAGRVLAVAIIAVVTAAVMTLSALSDLADISDLDVLGIDVGPGPVVALIGGAVALGGAIWALATRRRWPARPAGTPYG